MPDNSINLLKAIADETRYNIIKSLIKREKTVSELVKEVQKSQPNISIHLRLLELNGIISKRKQGKFKFFKIIDQKTKKIIEILE